jgi:hypothetical protein
VHDFYREEVDKCPSYNLHRCTPWVSKTCDTQAVESIPQMFLHPIVQTL